MIVYNPSTDLWSSVGAEAIDAGGKAGLAFDPISNILYFIERDGDLYTIDPTNGATSSIGTVPEISDPVGLTFVPILDGDFEPDGDVDASDLYKFSINFGKTY